MVEQDYEKYRHNYPALNLWLVLLKHTDAHHGLTIEQMRDEMMRMFGNNPDHPNFKKPGVRSIHNYLDYLRANRILGTQLYKVDVKELMERGITDFRPGTYITPIMDCGIATLIATMLRSSRLTGALVNETLDMLCNLAVDDAALPTLGRNERNPLQETMASAPTLSLVRELTEAIAADRAVTFEYANYNLFGELSYIDELNARAMAPSTRFVDPYAVVVKNERFYLLGHLHNSAMPLGSGACDATVGLQYYSLERMRGVRVSEENIVIHMDAWDVHGAPRHATGGAPFDPVAFTAERTHMVLGAPIPVTLRVNERLLGLLCEDYGPMIRDVRALDEAGAWYTVSLCAVEGDMRMWLLEHAAERGAFALAPRSLVQGMADATGAQAKGYAAVLQHYEHAVSEHAPARVPMH